jgi:endonuclease/exonuclease/phosphatase (EEP) superfamily protein YafD
MSLFIAILSILLISFTVLSLIKNDYWIFRIFDYPRLQKFALSLVCLALLVYFFESAALWYWLLVGAMTLNVIYLFSLIVPFTFLGKKQVLRATRHIEDQSLSIMIANVFQDNKNSKGCLSEIHKNDPDIVLLLETNSRWERETAELDSKYPFSVKAAQENTYGMLLYSKLELKDASIDYLVEKDIPSIHSTVILKNGQKVQLYCVHPTPPAPQENIRSTERDKELLLVADKAKDSTLPVIVIGDLNDVAWSYTTELFLKMSGLLDPRRGRGFFNSFHAHYPVLRFPLDHAFISTDFKLKEIRRLYNFDSDHFPIFISLQYEAAAVHQQEGLEADADDVELAEEKKAKE